MDADDGDSVTATLEEAQRLADQVRMDTTSCSSCGAQPGQRCRRPDGAVMLRPHVARGREPKPPDEAILAR